MFEHDTPIQTIRTMTPCDIEKLHLTPEKLAKADEYFYYASPLPKMHALCR